MVGWGKLIWLCVGALSCFAAEGPVRLGSPLDEWLAREKSVSERMLEANFRAAGAAPGAVIASPQQEGPNYLFHWVRDGALTMDVARREAARATSKAGRDHWEAYLRDYASFSRRNQLTETLTGLGEPKFLISGASFNGDWARPQNDGPALRASILIRWAQSLLDRGESEYVRAALYDGAWPASSLIKADLEYVAAHWREPCFDLWEEMKADHFYTRMVQWKALTEGAALADRLNDGGAAAWYRLQARELAGTLPLFLEGDQVNGSINWVEGVDFKKSNLDIAVVLAVLHADGGPWPLEEAHVRATFRRLVDRFASLYPINSRPSVPGVALGRYPEDLYAGRDFSGGNPWVLATLAGAEFSFKLALSQARQAGSAGRASARALVEEGDFFLKRLQYHAQADGAFSEQFDRNSGFMTSARDLTWSYAAFLTAYWSREEALRALLN